MERQQLSSIFKVTLFCILICACRQNKQPSAPVVSKTVLIPTPPKKIDTISAFGFKEESQFVDIKRYFLISYTTMPKESREITMGNTWFSANGFPRKKQIDSIVFRSLPMQRICYRNVIITSIFEFKNEDDFNSFIWQYSGDKNPVRKQCCRVEGWRQESWFYPIDSIQQVDPKNIIYREDTPYIISSSKRHFWVKNDTFGKIKWDTIGAPKISKFTDTVRQYIHGWNFANPLKPQRYYGDSVDSEYIKNLYNLPGWFYFNLDSTSTNFLDTVRPLSITLPAQYWLKKKDFRIPRMDDGMIMDKPKDRMKMIIITPSGRLQYE